MTESETSPVPWSAGLAAGWGWELRDATGAVLGKVHRKADVDRITEAVAEYPHLLALRDGVLKSFASSLESEQRRGDLEALRVDVATLDPEKPWSVKVRRALVEQARRVARKVPLRPVP